MRFATPAARQLLLKVGIAACLATASHSTTAAAAAAAAATAGSTCDALGRRPPSATAATAAFLKAPAVAAGPTSLRRDMSTSTSAATSTGSSLNLDSITLQRVTSEAGPLGEPIKAGAALWKPHGAVVFVVRRPGCVLCREEAMDLSTKLLPQLKQSGGKPVPKLVAVVAETTSVDGFLDAFADKGGETATYLDAARGFQVALGDRWLGVQGLLYPSVWKNGKRAQTKYPGLEGDLKGEGRRLGGLLVVDKEGQVKYSYLEKVFGDHAPMDEVLAAVQKL